MKISLIIPVYNQGQYLKECLDSVLNQTVKPHEIICVDDGSTDNSLFVAKDYEAKGVKVIHQVNKGLSSARNTGIMNATGDWILPLDSDDRLLPDCIDKLTKKLKKTKAEVVAPSFRCFGLSQQDVVLMENPKIEDFRAGNRVGYCSLIRRAVLLELGGYSPKMIWGYEDFHLWFNILSKGYTIETMPDILWEYRLKENSMIHTAQAHHHELIAQINNDFNLW